MELDSMKSIIVDENSFFYKSFGKEEFYKERIVVNK